MLKMNISSFCQEQREKQQTNQTILVIYGLITSTALHGLLAYASLLVSPRIDNITQNPIEFIIVDEPEPELKPEPEPKPELITEKPLEELPKPELLTKNLEPLPEPLEQVIQEPPQVYQPFQLSESVSTPIVQPEPEISLSKPPTAVINESTQPVQPNLTLPERSAPARPSSLSTPLSASTSEVNSPLNNAPSIQTPIGDAQGANPNTPGLVTSNRSQPVKPTSFSEPLAATEVSSELQEGLSSKVALQPNESTEQAQPNVAVAPERAAPARPGTSNSTPLSAEGSGINASLREGLRSNGLPQPRIGNPSTNPGSSNLPRVAARSQPTKPSRTVEPPPIGSSAGCVQRKKPKFPPRLERENIEARVEIEVTTDANGRAVSQKVIRSSGYSELDEAALSAASSVRCPSSGGERRVRIAISFVQKGTDFEREVRERQEELERKREEEERRLAELERQRAEELERQREAEERRQEELERRRAEELERQRQAEEQ